MKTQTNMKMLKLTILVIAMFQMPTLAISPAISKIMSQFGRDLATVQTALQIPNLVSPFAAILASIIVAKAKGKLPKKYVIIFGLGCIVVAATGIVLFSTQFWTLYLWGALIGVSIGLFIPTTASLMMDSFDEDAVRVISGQQTSFINIGGIIMSILGGLLADMIWFGGYLTFYFGVPIIILCIIYLPTKARIQAAAEQTSSGEPAEDKSKFNWNVAFYGFCIFFFMMCSNVSGPNLSVYVIDQLKIGTSSTTGYISAVQMLGGACSGMLFSKLSSKLRDYMIPMAFLTLCIGFTVLGTANSLVMIFIGAFLTGSAMSMCMPQCMFSISLYVDEHSSTFANAISSSIAPSLGGFLSPVIFTPLTTALFGEAVSSRYLFLSCVTLVLCVLLVVIMTARKKGGKAKGWS
ncbi:MAG: MFS transporter [Oscillospiraceae bacterium]|nr:MFS transporter [Oscillospiraceae bacterium]